MIPSRAALLLLAALVSSCTSAPPAPAPELASATTYAGEIPCADCQAQRLTLTLFRDFTYRLRRTYVGADKGKDAQAYELGRWARTQDGGQRLALRSGPGNPTQFRFVDASTLRLLDRDGREFSSRLNHDLARQSQVDRLEGPLRLRGMLMIQADAAVFNECLSGRRIAVLPEGEYRALERAYLSTRGAPGEFLAAIFSGRFVERPPEPDLPLREQLVVEKFERVLPGATCAPQAAGRAELLDTYWRPVEIDGAPVRIQLGTREPHLVFAKEGSRVRGYAGCNTLTGSYNLNGEALYFGLLAATRRACIGDGDALEAAFFKALHATASQRITGESLELRDADGKTRMRLEARYLR